MTYATAIATLVGLLFVGVVWMLLTAGDRKLFTGRLVGQAVKTVVIAGLISTASLLYREPGGLLSISGLFFVVLVGFSLYAWWYWTKQKLLEQDDVSLLRYEAPRAFAFWALATLSLLIGLTAKQLRYREAVETAGLMLLIVPATAIVFLPPLLTYVHGRWQRIPVVVKFREPWRLPIREEAPVIEPSADAVRVFFEVPVRENAEDSVYFDVSVPRRTTLGRVFHHLLYQHNVQERSRRQIAIALDNKSDFVYGWLLYRKRKRWWGTYKDYLDLEGPVRGSDLVNGERVYAERVRVWE